MQHNKVQLIFSADEKVMGHKPNCGSLTLGANPTMALDNMSSDAVTKLNDFKSPIKNFIVWITFKFTINH